MATERRRAQRYRLSATVELGEAEGLTRDISTLGVFFETKEPQPLGETIAFSVHLSEATVRCEGRVVRVENLNGKYGVAVELTSYTFD